MIFSSLRRIYAKEPVYMHIHEIILYTPCALEAVIARTNTPLPGKRAYFSLCRVKIEPFSSKRLIIFHI